MSNNKDSTLGKRKIARHRQDPGASRSKPSRKVSRLRYIGWQEDIRYRIDDVQRRNMVCFGGPLLLSVNLC